jgi:hypothetical protein
VENKSICVVCGIGNAVFPGCWYWERFLEISCPAKVLSVAYRIGRLTGTSQIVRSIRKSSIAVLLPPGKGTEEAFRSIESTTRVELSENREFMANND